MPIKVLIDPRCNVEYSAFYIKGLYDIYGRKNVSFDLNLFYGLIPPFNFNFIVSDSEVIVKYSVDFDDDTSIKDELYAWCDHYGKINYSSTKKGINQLTKILIIPPSFGIKLWGLFFSFYFALINYFSLYKQQKSLRKYLGVYFRQYKNSAIDLYSKNKSIANYIFSVNTLWNSDEWINNDETVNQMRLNFYTAVSSFDNVKSEVGFVYSKNKNDNSVFSDYILENPVSKSAYLQKTKESSIVFNTPAWALCHGWKLAEYLALGKAIISTPFFNELPVPLIHGENIHFVSGSVEDMKNAISLLLNDNDYRAKLEAGAWKYYLDYIQPKVAIKRLVEQV